MAIFAIQGCGAAGGDITPEMQKAKNDALKKADQDQKTGPKEDRGRD